MKKFCITIFIIICSSGIILSQYTWKNGYIILLNKDTLHGQIQIQEYSKMGNSCVFRRDENSSPKDYTPVEIIGYMIPKEGYYISTTIDDTKRVFLEYLVEGKLDLYYIRDDAGDRYFIQTDSLPLKELMYIEKFVKDDDGKEYLYKSKSHIGLLHLYTKDAQKLWKKIDNIDPDFKNLRNIAVDYHNMVCPGESCITYRNTDTYVQMGLGLYTGTMLIPALYGENTSKRYYPTFGFQLRIGAPRISRRLLFRTGAVFFRINNDLPNVPRYQWGIKIPIQFEYKILTKYGLTPKFSFGTNGYAYYGINIGGSVGLDLKLTQHIFLSFLYEQDILNFDGFIRSNENPFKSYLFGVDYHF